MPQAIPPTGCLWPGVFVGGKEDPLLGSDMRRRYVRLLTEVSVELKAGGTRPFVHVVYLLPDP